MYGKLGSPEAKWRGKIDGCKERWTFARSSNTFPSIIILYPFKLQKAPSDAESPFRTIKSAAGVATVHEESRRIHTGPQSVSLSWAAGRPHSALLLEKVTSEGTTERSGLTASLCGCPLTGEARRALTVGPAEQDAAPPADDGEAVRDGAMDPPEDEGRTFMEVISEKYSPENFPYRRGPGVGVVVPMGPQGSPMKDRLNLPSILVLNGCGISRAGDEAEISAFCAHVVELDLSNNKLQDWHEISKIVANIPNLDFLNLSSNPLSESPLDASCAEAFVRVRRLVLNSTHVSWETVHTFTREIPELEELFLCLNEYEAVTPSAVSCPSLRLLHITDNNLQDWGEVRKFGAMFPCLDTLVMANNNLASIQDSGDALHRLFPKLRSINLHNSGLNRWEDIEKLNCFPKLEEVRLLGIPLLQTYTNTERRSLTVAHLPSVSVLNGSKVTDEEREDAERFFIRYHLDCPEKELPYRYHCLVTKYGKLAPLADIDLRPRFRAKVEVRYEDRVEVLSIRLDQTVAELKKQLRTVVQLSTNNMRLYYIDKEVGCAFGPEEMKYSTRALHNYNIRDGDEILVVPKSK